MRTRDLKQLAAELSLIDDSKKQELFCAAGV
jgi:hypothetical protein